MNKTASLFLIIIALQSSGLSAQEIEWKLPYLPVAITYSTAEGFGIKGTAALVTPIGQFSISSPTYKISHTTGHFHKTVGKA